MTTARWTTPGGTSPGLCEDIIKQPHTLIAGATGSGKSVLINALIYSLTFRDPEQVKLILIDPKRVELNQWRSLPHTIRYASEPADIAAAIRYAVDLMESRYTSLQQTGAKRYTGAEVYIIVDEFADLITTQKKEVLPPLCRIAQLGRAAGIHLIIATQRPTRDIITGQIKVNIDARVALRCPTAQDSRNIINIKGAESLPRYGTGLYLTPDTMLPIPVDIPFIQPAELDRRAAFWIAQRPRPRRRTLKSLFNSL